MGSPPPCGRERVAAVRVVLLFQVKPRAYGARSHLPAPPCHPFAVTNDEAPLHVYLVLDSTEITGDWLLDSATYREAARVPNLQLAVPSPVRLEVEGNHSRAVTELDALTRRMMKERRRLGLPPAEVFDSAIPYSEQLHVAFRRVGIVTLPWPEVPHETVVQRSVGRTPPFDGKGGGYRDTLVWLSARDLAAAGRTVYLASRDRAFQDDNGELARELQDELTDLRGSVELVTNLRQWILERATASVRRAPTPELSEQREDIFQTYFLSQWWFEDTWLAPDEAGLPPEAGRAYIDNVIEWGGLQETTTRDLLGGGVYVEYEMEVRLELAAQVPIAFAHSRGWMYTDIGDPGIVAVKPIVFALARFGVIFDSGADAGQEPHDDELDEHDFSIDFITFNRLTSPKYVGQS